MLGPVSSGPTLLVTGFGPFLGNAENPSEHLAHAVSAHHDLGVRFVPVAPLPVVFGAAAARVLEVSEGLDAPVATLALGLASRASHVRLERLARNRSSANDPDALGVRGEGRAVHPGGPEVLACPLPLEALGEVLARAGFSWSVSEDAGGYVCNDLYYRLLHAHHLGRTLREGAPGAGKTGPHASAPPTVFVHVPPDAHRMPGLARALAEGMVAAVSGPKMEGR